MRPSTVISLRWLRRIQNGSVSRGGLKTRTSTPGLAQAPPETGQGAEGRAEPVVEHPHANAGAGALDQGIREGAAGLVVGDDEVLEMDDRLRRADRLEPGRIVLPRIPQQRDRVALAQVAVGDACEGPLETQVVQGLRDRVGPKLAELGRHDIHDLSTHETGISAR